MLVMSFLCNLEHCVVLIIFSSKTGRPCMVASINIINKLCEKNVLLDTLTNFFRSPQTLTLSGATVYDSMT